MQTWLAGDVLSGPPVSDAAWRELLGYLARIHLVRLDDLPIDLPPAAGPAGREVAAVVLVDELTATAATEKLPEEVRAVVEAAGPWSRDLRLGPARSLCRVDHNTSNYLRAEDGALRSVDWEYAGRGDTAEDVAELMSHPRYMSVPGDRWPWVIEAYTGAYTGACRDADAPDLGPRIRALFAIMITAWVLRLARSLAGTAPAPRRLVARAPDELEDTRQKLDYYLGLARRYVFA